MRTMTALAFAAALSLGTPVLAQAQAASSTAQAPANQQEKATVQISSIQVVDVKQLPETMKTQVEDVVSRTSEADMAALRKSIDASPAAADALKQKGITSAQVVAVNIADGVLTMFAKTA